MKIVCPVLENKLFKTYGNIDYKTFVNSKKLTGKKKVNKIRNNTIKIVQEIQPVFTLGELLERDIENNKQKETEPVAIEKLNIKPALLRWGLLKIGKVNHKSANYEAKKQKRLNARINARNRKSVLQEYQYDLSEYQNGEQISEKESDLQNLVAEYEMESLKTMPYSISAKDLATWVIVWKAKEIRNQRIKSEAEEQELKDSAEAYFKHLRIKENNSIKNIEKETESDDIDLQDFYELSHYNVNVLVNYVNQKVK